ncbi:hypothetical protein BH09BAC6_BH09BAC6_21550 [soil metagenome]
MQKKRRILMALLLAIAIIFFTRLSGNGNIRTIQFIWIFLIGALTALLLNEFVSLFRGKRS